MTPYLYIRENGTETGPDLLQESLLDEKGTVEAGLVIIPTTLLFLMILQILFAGSWQVMERAKLHDLVVRSSLSEATSERSSGDSKNSSYFGEYGGQKVGSGAYGSGVNVSSANGSSAFVDVEFADLYLLEKFYFLSRDSFSSNSKISSTKKPSAYGDLHKIEVNTQIPIFHGILKFFGVEGVGIRNTAVLIEN